MGAVYRCYVCDKVLEPASEQHVRVIDKDKEWLSHETCVTCDACGSVWDQDKLEVVTKRDDGTPDRIRHLRCRTP